VHKDNITRSSQSTSGAIIVINTINSIHEFAVIQKTVIFEKFARKLKRSRNENAYWKYSYAIHEAVSARGTE